jgi:hypothetical protein
MKGYNHGIAEAIRVGDYDRYLDLRYARYQEGDDILFREEDFSGVDFNKLCEGFDSDFFTFDDCNLSGSRGLSGFSVTIRNSNSREIDLRGSRLIMEAVNTDFTGMKYDEDTRLGYGDGERVDSVFTDCVVDTEMRRYFQGQGVKFRVEK